MAKLILLRHGESVWNQRNLFTGWVDIPLSERGVEEAYRAGEAIAEIPIDLIYTSPLIRSIMTATLAMLKHSSGKVPVIQHPDEGKMEAWGTIDNPNTAAQMIPLIRAWQLNERMYGSLQGNNKDDARAKYGAEQVQIWRRSYSTPPPNGESLEMTAKRALPYFEQRIVPQIREGRNVLISAHGNSLRSIIMELDQLTEDEVVKLELPTGAPIVYNYVAGSFVKDVSLVN